MSLGLLNSPGQYIEFESNSLGYRPAGKLTQPRGIGTRCPTREDLSPEYRFGTPTAKVRGVDDSSIGLHRWTCAQPDRTAPTLDAISRHQGIARLPFKGHTP